MPDTQDKAPLQAYLTAILDAVLGAVSDAEAKHPGWEVGASTLTVRAALKPQVDQQGKVTIWADMDVGSSEQVSEIPLPIRRKPKE